MKKILVIFSQYNNSHLTIKAINSIETCLKRGFSFFFLVIDDRSNNLIHYHKIKQFSKSRKNVFLIRNRINFGYFRSISKNLSYKKLENYDYIWFGNNDVDRFSLDYFIILRKLLDNSSLNAAASGTVIDENFKKNFRVKRKYFLKKKELSDVGFLIKISTLKKVGTLSDSFTYEFCDLNYESRIKKKKLKCIYSDKVNFRHSTKSSSRKIYKSKINIQKRYIDLIQLYFLEKKLFSLQFLKVLINEIRYVLNKNYKLLPYCVSGIIIGIKNILN